MNLNDRAEVEKLVRECFSLDSKRLRHIEVIAQNVLGSAEKINQSWPELNLDVNLTYRAALLHDIGYARTIRKTGFHPFDGADFLIQSGYPELAELIAGHSCSPEEAILMGFSAIEPNDSIPAKLISYWDMRVKQGGEIVTYAERLAEIIARYGENSLVGRANLAAKPRLEKIFQEIEGLLVTCE